MPAVLRDDTEVAHWLQADKVPLLKALDQCLHPTDCLQWHPVTRRMGNIRYQEEDCRRAISLEQKPPKPTGLMVCAEFLWCVQRSRGSLFRLPSLPLTEISRHSRACGRGWVPAS